MMGAMIAKPVTVYAKASIQTWELVRAAYLSGLSAPTVAARFGVSVSAIRKRARREGWTKAAYASAARAKDAPGPDATETGGPEPADDPFEAAMPRFHVEPGGLARRALEQAAQALAGGRPQDAVAYARAAEAIARLDAVVPPFSVDESPEQAAWRQSTVERSTLEMARLIAARMIDGADPPPSYRAAVAAWRREHGR